MNLYDLLAPLLTSGRRSRVKVRRLRFTRYWSWQCTSCICGGVTYAETPGAAIDSGRHHLHTFHGLGYACIDCGRILASPDHVCAERKPA